MAKTYESPTLTTIQFDLGVYGDYGEDDQHAGYDPSHGYGHERGGWWR